MRYKAISAVFAGILALGASAALADSNAVKVDISADMPSLSDPSQNDVFDISVNCIY